MPTYKVHVDINAPIDQVFAYISDLTKHPEWAADPLTIEAASPIPIAIGSHYRSSAVAQGKTITTELVVSAYEPLEHFGFIVNDLTGKYQHDFWLYHANGMTHVDRHVKATLSLPQTLLFYLVFPTIKRPNTQRAMENLKRKLETT